MPNVTGLSLTDGQINADIINCALALGGEVVIPDSSQGYWPISNSGAYILKMPKAGIFRCSSNRGTLKVAQSTPITQDVLLVKSNPDFERNWVIQDLYLGQAAGNIGRNGIYIETNQENQHFFNLQIKNCYIPPFSGAGIATSSTDSPGDNAIQGLLITDCTIGNGISLTKIADSCVINRNMISGKSGIFVNFLLYAGTIIIRDNNIASSEFSLVMFGGINPYITGNFFEIVTATGSNPALIYIQDAVGLSFKNNMVNAGPSRNCVYLNMTKNSIIEDNVMYVQGTHGHIKNDGTNTNYSRGVYHNNLGIIGAPILF